MLERIQISTIFKFKLDKRLMKIINLLLLCYTISNKHQWSSGRIVPCHGTDPGSIPGWCISLGAMMKNLCNWRVNYYHLLTGGWIIDYASELSLFFVFSFFLSLLFPSLSLLLEIFNRPNGEVNWHSLSYNLLGC